MTAATSKTDSGADSAATTVVHTRQQNDLRDALEDVTAVLKETKHDEKIRKAYGSLCHALPPMVLADGLCQTLAFIESKAANDRAYALLRASIARVLGVASPEQLLPTVASRGVAEYVRDTRRLLRAWVYYKRFAVSVLGVRQGEQSDATPGETAAGAPNPSPGDSSDPSGTSQTGDTSQSGATR